MSVEATWEAPVQAAAQAELRPTCARAPRSVAYGRYSPRTLDRK
jgi:hypothetical protein